VKKQLICLILCLFSLSNTVYAAHWVLVDQNVEANVYVDTDTVVQTGDHLFYWEREILNDIFEGRKKVLRKDEVILSSPKRQSRQLEFYGYDPQDREISQDTTPTSFLFVAPVSVVDHIIDFALQYARPWEGSDKPAP